jgi:transposase-like protein
VGRVPARHGRCSGHPHGFPRIGVGWPDPALRKSGRAPAVGRQSELKTPTGGRRKQGSFRSLAHLPHSDAREACSVRLPGAIGSRRTWTGASTPPTLGSAAGGGPSTVPSMVTARSWTPTCRPHEPWSPPARSLSWPAPPAARLRVGSSPTRRAPTHRHWWWPCPACCSGPALPHQRHRARPRLPQGPAAADARPHVPLVSGHLRAGPGAGPEQPTWLLPGRRVSPGAAGPGVGLGPARGSGLLPQAIRAGLPVDLSPRPAVPCHPTPVQENPSDYPRWVQAFGPRLAADVRRRRRPVGGRWSVDEVVLIRRGHKHHLYRATDEDGVVVDVLLRQHRDTASAETFFREAIERTGVIPHEVITARHQPYIKAVASACPGALHIRTGLHRARGATTRAVERSHVPTRDRLPNSRGLKQTETGQRFLEGFEAVRHLRRGGAPGAGHLVRGPAQHARVRQVVAVIHTLGRGLHRQP